MASAQSTAMSAPDPTRPPLAIQSMSELEPETVLRSRRSRLFVLLGSSLIQLPIWGFAMSYGVFQEFYRETPLFLTGLTGVIGTTSNGVIYLSMPILFALFSIRYARYRRHVAAVGIVLVTVSFLASSFSTNVSHLILTQGVTSALGSALIFSPATLSLGEHFDVPGGNRALAYGVTLSAKNIVGSTCAFLFRWLLDRYGFRTTLRIWAVVVFVTATLSVSLIPTPAATLTSRNHRRKTPWTFLRHRSFWIYSVAITSQSAGYGIPQTYLPTFAREISHLSQTNATLLIIVFNLPGILSCIFFGWLADHKTLRLSASTTTALSAIATAASAFLLWGFTGPNSLVLLLIFSMTFGFFAGGYSATWGGVLKLLEVEARKHNEALDSGLVYGLLNGARGLGYVAGGVAGLPLLKTATGSLAGAYASRYGALILFTGASTVVGGWGLLWPK